MDRAFKGEPEMTTERSQGPLLLSVFSGGIWFSLNSRDSFTDFQVGTHHLDSYYSQVIVASRTLALLRPYHASTTTTAPPAPTALLLPTCSFVSRNSVRWIVPSRENQNDNGAITKPTFAFCFLLGVFGSPSTAVIHSYRY